MQIDKDRLVQEFISLVQIDSLTGKERAIADVLTQKLEKLGFSVTEDRAGETISGDCGNLIAKLDGDSERPTLLFCAHMDRVSPGSNIKPQIENGILKSDGTTILAADDVAGLVTILEGIRVVQEQKISHGPIEVVFTIAEEGGLHGAKALDASCLEAKLGYFLDTGGPVGTIIHQAPYQKNIKIIFYGKAAHAGINPEKGINAILVASHALTNMDLGRIDAETTANIGVIQAGTATNVIPDQADLKGEARSLDPEKLQAQILHMAEVSRKAAQKFGVKADIEIKDNYPGFDIPSSSSVLELAIRAGKSIGLSPEIHSAGGGSDANILNATGIPSVILGLNFMDVHSKNETIAIDDLVKSAQYVVALMEQA